MRILFRISMILSLVLVPATASLLLCGCETTQGGSGLSVSNVVGSVAGGVLPGQAGSLVKVASAVGKTFQDITPEQEYFIGRAVAANVMATYSPSTDDNINMYLNLLGQTLARASDRPETFGGYHFLMLDSPEINAFAAPGGLILVTRGMIHLCKSEDALAAVLAHEIAHVQGQHGLKAIKSSRLTNAFTVIASEAAKNYSPAEISSLTEAFEGSITDITQSLMNNGYSRDLEREADKGAVTILRRVGYDPNALISMLGEMQKQLKPGGPGFAKTHPDPKDRIADLKPLVSGAAVKPVSQNRQKRFQAALNGV